MEISNATVRVPFEVFGKVQKVFFRKFTQAQAASLGIHGWCDNSSTGTVRGEIEGSRASVDQMKRWLSNEGSPKSTIDKCVFGTEVVSEKKYTTFGIRK